MSKLKKLIKDLLGSSDGRRGLEGRNLAPALGAMAVVLLLSAVAHAAGGGGHHGSGHINWWTWDQHEPPVGWFLIDGAIFVGLLWYLLRKPMKGMFAKRHETIKTSIDEAQAAFTKAKAHYDEYHTKLQRVDDEIQSLIDGAKREGAELKASIISNATEYASTLRKDTASVVSQEEMRAKIRLHEELVQQALEKADSVLRGELTEKDQQRLIEEAITEIENGRPVATTSTKAAQPSAGGAA